MEDLSIALPTSTDDWTAMVGADLDDKVRQLDVAGRRIEAAIVGATEYAIEPVTSPTTGIARSETG